MKELLENAVLSIKLGVEGYQTGDDRRVLSAIRNLYADVLLLCKQVLWSWRGMCLLPRGRSHLLNVRGYLQPG